MEFSTNDVIEALKTCKNADSCDTCPYTREKRNCAKHIQEDCLRVIQNLIKENKALKGENIYKANRHKDI
jgi:hypothetical protein